MTDKQDSLEGIREQIGDTIDIDCSLCTYSAGSNHPKDCFDIPETTPCKRRLDKADQILSLKVSRGGGVCPECKGKKIIGVKYRNNAPPYIPAEYTCPACKGTGILPVEEKTLKEIIEEWEDG